MVDTTEFLEEQEIFKNHISFELILLPLSIHFSLKMNETTTSFKGEGTIFQKLRSAF